MGSAAIVIEDYNPEWPVRFEALCVPVRRALGNLALRIEHVGSTAIPGLAAKPIIDMDVVIGARSDLDEAIRRLASIGYRHEGDLGIADREAFAHATGLSSHHLYVCSSQSAELRRHLLFRDYLRAHPEEVGAYAQLKWSLAERFRTDREAYTLAKGDFVTGILARAGSGD